MRFFLIIFLLCWVNSVYAKDQPFECNTSKHRIIINETSPGHYQYRSWNLPKKTSDKPDLVIAEGSNGFAEDTSFCGDSMYQFIRGKVQYIVSDYVSINDNAPENAIGLLEVKINDKTKSKYWCLTKDANMNKAVIPWCGTLRCGAIDNPVREPWNYLYKNSRPWNIEKPWDIDINNDGKLDKVISVRGNTSDFSGSFLIAFIDENKDGIANLAKMDYKEVVKYIPDDNTPGGIKFHKDLNAYSISLGQAKSSPKYVYNIPFYYPYLGFGGDFKIYILAVEDNTNKLPAQSISIIEANNKAKILCNFPDAKKIPSFLY